jgi:hypothetical protein
MGFGAAAHAALRLRRLVGDDEVSLTTGINVLSKVRAITAALDGQR